MRARSKEKGYCCFSFKGSALSILIAARSLVHEGWHLLHHPLYGNFRPYQQPYRSLLLKYDPSSFSSENGPMRIIADDQSLHYLEEAISLFQNVKVITPDQAPQAYLADCSVLDYELMRLPLEQAGWPMESPLV